MLKVVSILLIGILALVAIVEYEQVSTEKTEVDSLNIQVANDQLAANRFQSTISNLEVELNSSRANVQQLRLDNSQLTSQITTLMNENSKLSSQSPHPTLPMWNFATTMTSGTWRALVVPDTFDYNVSFSSDTQITVFFFNLDQFVQFHDCGQSCVSGNYTCLPNCTTTTNAISNQVFRLAEGCAGYVSVFYQPSSVHGSGQIRPNVVVTYNPSSTLTGWCGS